MEKIPQMKEFYTYAYLREDGTPYYIGKGRGNRIYSKQRGVKAPKNKSRIIFLKKDITEEEAFKHEVYMIFVFGRKDLGTGILRNKTNGGEGATGRQWSEKSRDKVRLAQLGNNHATGYRLSEEHKEQIRRAQLGRKASEKSRERNRLSHLGKRMSEVTKEKIGLANRGRKKPPFSPEHLEKLSKSHKGFLHWTNGFTNKMSPDCPGDGWVRGRTINKFNSTK